jgi:glycosyltransferase involved in cell wall biosynthesis
MNGATLPRRVLHVVRAMNRGGAETWLMHVLRNLDRDRFRLDFLVHTTEPGAYDAEIRELGGRIIPCLEPARPLLYARNLRRVLREHGPYDVVHSHVHHFSGYVLRVAAQEGVPVRIAHSHTDSSGRDTRAGLSRRAYLSLMQRWIAAHATAGIACSRPAGGALFGEGWQQDPRVRTLYCGIDLEPFRQRLDRAAVRQELGIPADALVLGHVGRFDAAKNQAFAVQVAAEVMRRRPDAWLLLVGDGTTRPAVERQVQDLRIAERTVFAGIRPDVPRLMCGAMDAFVFPSLYEGLSLVLIETQAAGLPSVVSDANSEEVEIVAPLMRRLPLTAAPAEWAETLLRMLEQPSLPSLRETALATVGRSAFDIRQGTRHLAQLYLQHAGSQPDPFRPALAV